MFNLSVLSIGWIFSLALADGWEWIPWHNFLPEAFTHAGTSTDRSCTHRQAAILELFIFFPDRYYMYCKCNYLKKDNVLINKCKLNIL